MSHVGRNKFIRRARRTYKALNPGARANPHGKPNYSNPGCGHVNAHLFAVERRARHNHLRSGSLPVTARTVAEKLKSLGDRLRTGDL